LQNTIETTLNSQILDFCSRVAGSGKLLAVGLVDNQSSESTGEKPLREALVVVKGFQPKIMSYFKNINDNIVFFLVVDQRVFESDIRRGFMGEAFAGKLIFHYVTLYGKEYLDDKEFNLKRRLVLEELENLALTYPELVYHMKIKPQYFLYETILNRLRNVPLLSYEFSGFLKDIRLQNETESLTVYKAVLQQLSKDGVISITDDYVTISKEFIHQKQKSKGGLHSITRNVQRTLFSSLFESFPQILSQISQNANTIFRTQHINWRNLLQEPQFVDSHANLFVPTSGSMVSLAERINIRQYVEKLFFSEGAVDVEIKSLGGVLNDVYLISASVKGEEQRVLVKRFKEWSGFKWFPQCLVQRRPQFCSIRSSTLSQRMRN
jgi:hypothetical protein